MGFEFLKPSRQQTALALGTEIGQVDRRVRKTLQAIHVALARLLGDRAWEQITAKDIAVEADIGYTTFFRHFSSKEAAIASLADEEASALIGEAFPLLRAGVSIDATLEMCRHVERNRTVWGALLCSSARSFVRDALKLHTVKAAEGWQGDQDWLPRDTGPSLIIGLVVETLGWWLAEAPELSADEVARVIDRLFIARLVGEGNKPPVTSRRSDPT